MTESGPPGDSHQPVWMSSFDESDRKTQLTDDSHAWRQVTGLLLLVVAIGLIIAVGAVILSA